MTLAGTTCQEPKIARATRRFDIFIAMADMANIGSFTDNTHLKVEYSCLEIIGKKRHLLVYMDMGVNFHSLAPTSPAPWGEYQIPAQRRATDLH